MTSPHDITEVGGCSVTCRCGRAFTASSMEKARDEHADHFGLELLRAALPPGDDAA